MLVINHRHAGVSPAGALVQQYLMRFRPRMPLISTGFDRDVVAGVGRRRVGKSTLIRKFVEDKKAVLFTAIESTSDRNLELFSKSIYKTYNCKN